MVLDYFRTFYSTQISEDLIDTLVSFLPEPEDEMTEHVIQEIIGYYQSQNLNSDLILIKFWIMSGLSSSILFDYLDLSNLDRNSADWIVWDSKIRGDNVLLDKISSIQSAKNSFDGINDDFENWEHFLLLFDPKIHPEEKIRNEAYDSLEEISEKSTSVFFPIFEFYTEIHKEYSEIPTEKHIIALDKILSKCDWNSIGIYWHSSLLIEFARVQTDFSDISGANETLQEIKNLSWSSPYFLGLVLRLEAKINNLLNQHEEMDHLFQSSNFYFQKTGNNKDLAYNTILQSSYWRNKSRERSLSLLEAINDDFLKKINNNWINGLYFSNLATINSASEKHNESCKYFQKSAYYFQKTIDKLNYWRNLIDYGFNLYVLKKFDEISSVINLLKDFRLPTMFEFRIAYLNAIAQYKNSNVKEAITTLETSIQEAQKVLINPQIPWFYSLLGEIYRIKEKWIITIDYFSLAMRSYFNLNEVENALKSKLVLSYLYLLIEKEETAIKLINEIRSGESLDKNLLLEVQWFLIKFHFFFHPSNKEKISETIRDFNSLIDSFFSGEINLLLKKMTIMITKPNNAFKLDIEISELYVKVRNSSKLTRFDRGWLIELNALIFPFLLSSRKSDTKNSIDYNNYLFSVTEFNYPETKAENDFKTLLQNDNLSIYDPEKLLQIRKQSLIIGTERAIYRVLAPIFPLNLY